MPEVKGTHALPKKQAEESGDSLILDLFVQKIEELGDDVQPELDDLEDGETRGLLYGRADGDDYFDVQIKPPTEIFRFLEEKVLKDASGFFPPETEAEGGGTLTKILVLPSLPTAEPFRSQSVELLKGHGVDAIISFRSMLLDILDKIEINQNYSKSDTLQVMRILKNYDLLKDTQLDMFPDRAARRPKA